MTPARFRWGLLLILIGVLVILENTGVIAPDFWLASIISIFALFLIAIGIEKIFNRSKLKIISYASSVLFVVAVLALALESSSHFSDTSVFSSKVIRESMKSTISEVKAYVDLGDDDLRIRESTNDLLWARFDEGTFKPHYEYKVEGDQAIVRLTPTKSRIFGSFVRMDLNDYDEWRLEFSRVTPLELEVVGNESDIHLNLSSVPLRKLNLKADKASVYLRLGDFLPDINVAISGDRSRLKLRFPNGTGLKVTGVDDVDFFRRTGLTKENGYYISEGYDSLTNRIQLDLDDGYSSLSIDYY